VISAPHDTREMAGATIELFWIPLGAGTHVVRWSGRTYERLLATLTGRPIQDLYHAALLVRTSRGRVTIEMTPVPRSRGERGVVTGGPVGSRVLGRFRVFRYEIRRWLGGSIPDLAWAVDSPRRLSFDAAQADCLLELVPSVPGFTWGRDEGGWGEMWNSNSVVSWLLERSGLDPASVMPPRHGRAPGWRAGIDAAGEDPEGTGSTSPR
jgi:hypothetical protein